MKKQFPVIFLASVALLFVFSLGCRGDRPRLNIRHISGGVKIDLSSLGEYQTEVARFRITDKQTALVVWEFAAERGTPQIWDVSLAVGENPTDPPSASGGEYLCLVPDNEEVFRIESGQEYVVEVCNKKQKCRKETFMINSAGSAY